MYILRTSTHHYVIVINQVPEGLSKPKLFATVCGVRTAEKTVTYETPAKKIFIQTDKPIYKPGQKSEYILATFLDITR